MTDARPLLRKMESIGTLADDERRALDMLPIKVVSLKPGDDVVRDGDSPTQCCILLDGFMHRYKILEEGKRQILAFHVSGDIPDLQSLHIRRMDHNLAATTVSTVGLIAHKAIEDAAERFPNLGKLFWREILIDAAIFRAWIASMGRRSAEAHLGHMLCELHTRLRAVGLAGHNTCDLPLTQNDLADALGFSTVHVNRTLQSLRRDGLIALQSNRLTILDEPRLRRLAQFDPTYLNLKDID